MQANKEDTMKKLFVLGFALAVMGSTVQADVITFNDIKNGLANATSLAALQKKEGFIEQCN